MVHSKWACYRNEICCQNEEDRYEPIKRLQSYAKIIAMILIQGNQQGQKVNFIQSSNKQIQNNRQAKELTSIQSIMIANKEKQGKSKSQQLQQSSPSVKSADYFQYINQNELVDYFKNIKISSVSQKKSDFYAYERFLCVTEEVYQGSVELGQSQNVNNFLAKQRLTHQEQKAKQLKNKRIQILNQLAMLDDQVSKSKKSKNGSLSRINASKSFSIDDHNNISGMENQQELDLIKIGKPGKLILSQEEHKQMITKIIHQRQEREKKRKQIKKEEQQKNKRLQEVKQSQFQKKQQQKRKRAEEIQEKLKKKREMHEKFVEQEKESDKKVKQIKNKKFLYEQIQQRYQLNIKLPFLEEQKKILKDKRQFSKAYSIDQIKNHEKSYIEQRQSSIQKSQAKQIIKPSQLYKAPTKSTKLQKILQDQKIQRKKKLIEKKRTIEEKLHRQQNYVEYLKEIFVKVKIDKTKQDEIKNRIQRDQLRREPQIDFKAIGMNYLAEAKRLRKKPLANHIETQRDQKKGDEDPNITALSEQNPNKLKTQRESRLVDNRQNLLLKKRQQKIQQLIEDEGENGTERIKKLKSQTQRISQAFRMKEQMLKYGYSQKVQDEAVELLLTNIQAKMGIINISK